MLILISESVCGAKLLEAPFYIIDDKWFESHVMYYAGGKHYWNKAHNNRSFLLVFTYSIILTLLYYSLFYQYGNQSLSMRNFCLDLGL